MNLLRHRGREVDWINVAQDRDRWLAFVETAMKSEVP
jgi:hypothetical protein